MTLFPSPRFQPVPQSCEQLDQVVHGDSQQSTVQGIWHGWCFSGVIATASQWWWGTWVASSRWQRTWRRRTPAPQARSTSKPRQTKQTWTFTIGSVYLKREMREPERAREGEGREVGDKKRERREWERKKGQGMAEWQRDRGGREKREERWREGECVCFF